MANVEEIALAMYIILVQVMQIVKTTTTSVLQKQALVVKQIMTAMAHEHARSIYATNQAFAQEMI